MVNGLTEDDVRRFPWYDFHGLEYPRGLCDFNNDGKAVLIWKNDTCEIVAIWLLKGTFIASSKILGGIVSAWEIEQVGDMNADVKADVV